MHSKISFNIDHDGVTAAVTFSSKIDRYLVEFFQSEGAEQVVMPIRTFAFTRLDSALEFGHHTVKLIARNEAKDPENLWEKTVDILAEIYQGNREKSDNILTLFS